ncbi:TIGR03086 family metal-binding protein [Streptomyces sp. GLT-R25]
MGDGGTTPSILDLGPQALIVARLAEEVGEEQLDAVTPCPEYAVRHLLGHLAGLSTAFRDAGRKDLGATTDTDPTSQLPDVTPGWRAELPKVLGELAEAWRDPAAWTGETRAGGVELPGEIAGIVAADELVVHGWDLARADRPAVRPRRGGPERGVRDARALGGRPVARNHLRAGRARAGGGAPAGPGDRSERPGPGVGARRLSPPLSPTAVGEGLLLSEGPNFFCQKR